MASRRLLANENHDSCNFFNWTSHIKQTPMRLFEVWDCDQLDISAEVGRKTSQKDVSGSVSSHSESLVLTSPTSNECRRITPVTPNAPIKSRKHFSVKVGLKPKKLHFIDKERDEIEDGNYSQKSADYSIKVSNQKASFSKPKCELKGKLNKDHLSVMLQSIQLETDNKENRQYGKERKVRENRSFAKDCANSAINSSTFSQSSKLSHSKKDSVYYSSVLSQDDSTLDWQKLLWLQPRRDVGLMIQCCRKSCNKWRACDDYHDPVDVPRIWYCEMNSDKTIASCSIPEIQLSKEMENDLIENEYNAGSIVWAYIKGFPWWPAMVDDCPETLRFYELREPSIIPVKYHVVFLGDKPQHAWVPCQNIKMFTKYKKSTLIKKTKYKGVDYKEQLKKAYILAQTAISLSILQRLQKFSYISYLRKIQDFSDDIMIHDSMNISFEEEYDEIIPATPTPKDITLKEFCTKEKNSTFSFTSEVF